MGESRLKVREFAIRTYRDGGHFAPHIDTAGTVQILSCFYYFATTPRHFSNSELRLHGFPLPASAPAPIADIAAETDSLVIFPSWLRHEVLPVAVPSATWLDSRFTLNGWIHRGDGVDAAAPRS